MQICMYVYIFHTGVWYCQRMHAFSELRVTLNAERCVFGEENSRRVCGIFYKEMFRIRSHTHTRTLAPNLKRIQPHEAGGWAADPVLPLLMLAAGLLANGPARHVRM